MKKGFSLVEILVALAIFGLLSGIVLSSLLGLFRANRATGSEARAVVVAKNYLEQAVKETTYTASGSSYILSLPAATQTAGFQVNVEAGGRLPTDTSVTLTPCSLSNNTYTCTVNCIQTQSNGTTITVKCPLVIVRLTLSGSGKTYTFYREWTP